MADSCESQILSNAYADFIVEFDGNVENIKLLYDTECVQVINGSFAIFTAPVTRMETLGQFEYNSVPKIYGLMDSTSMDSSGITGSRQNPFLSLSGRNVLVGVIDTGIDYTHPAFRYADGSSRILSIWDQSDQTGTPPSDFIYGSEYSKDLIDRALASENPLEIVPEQDTNGHGTFMAGLAAGNEMPEDGFTGAAPQSQLVIVKLKPCKDYLRSYYLIPDSAEAYQESDLMMALWYLRRYSLLTRKAISILIGLGTNNGDHNGNSYLSRYIDEVGNLRGMCVSAPVGNEGNRAGHYLGRISSEGSYEDVEIRIDSGERGFIMELWGTAPDIYSIGLIAPDGEQIERIPPRYGQVLRADFVLEPARVFVQYFLVESESGNQVIVIRLENPSSGIWRLRVYGDRLLFRGYHVWLPISDFISSGTYFLKPDPSNTITSPGDTFRCINTAAYNHYNNSIYVQSGRGYTPEGMVVPDLAAPGVNVFGPAAGGGFTRKTGTSVAAAHCAGAAALLLEWGIYKRNNVAMDTTEIKKLFIRGARRSMDLEYPNPIWGYGTLDLYNVFLYVSL